MLDFLKSNFNLSTIFSLWAIFCLMSYWYHKRSLFKWSAIIGLLIFLLCSTSYMPEKLVENLEANYKTINYKQLDTAKMYGIHVLGAGYTPDPNLSATAQLDLRTLGRLIEGIQIFVQLPKSRLITSGYAHKNPESQASVARRAAIELGVPKDHIEMLETPSTTWEEVLAFKDKFGDSLIPIVVTDAIHMPRAIKMYKAAGYEAIAAPTNFKVKHGPRSYFGFSLPNVHSIKLMDSWLHEVLGEWKWEVEVRR